MAIEKSTEDQQNDDQPKKETGQNEEQISMSKSDLEALINSKLEEKISQGQSSDVISQLTESLKSAIQGDTYTKPDPFSYRSPASIDREDILEDPLIFWAPGFHFVIGDDKKNGIAIPTPYQIIEFKPEGSRKNQRGKEIDIQIWSTYKCQSKKEAQWLKDHTLYGIRFFTKSADAVTADTRYTQKLAEYAQALRNTEPYRIIQQAKEAGEVFTDDVDTLRLVLAKKKTEDYMKQFEVERVKMLDRNNKKDLLNQK